jgi:hypothetical protein
MTSQEVINYLENENENEINSEKNLLTLQTFMKNIDKERTGFIQNGGILKTILFLNKYENLDTQHLELLFKTMNILTQQEDGVKDFSSLSTEVASHLVSLFYANFNNQNLIYGKF